MLLAAMSVIAACTTEAPQQPGPTGQTEILWDSYGIPHIFAPDNRELFRAFGWAQMHSHGDLILREYGLSRGRAAEYWGQDHLDSDRWVLTQGIPARSKTWLEQQDPDFRSYLEGFAQGMNQYAQEHPDRLEESLKAVLPIQPADILNHTQRTIHFTFVTSPQAARSAQRQWQAAGSNAWAIAPSRSQSGHSLLLANPHLPWSGLYLFYEAHLVAPAMNAYGVTLVGLPSLGIAFNDHLGWTHTVNTHDGQDFYQLDLQGGGYLWDGQVRAFETESHTIKVRQPDGSLKEEELLVRRSVHGPVVVENGDRALALRVVGLDSPHLGKAWWDMSRAGSLQEFESILSRLQLPMFTVMYADRKGNILHLFGGRTPKRPPGNYNWAGIVPGDTSETLWTETHPYEDLPRVLNPSSGWLQNANDPPWTTTFDRALNPGDFPRYMAPRFMHFRAQRSARMLIEDGAVSLDEMVRYKHSTRMEAADRILDALIDAARQRGGEVARRAADVLASWDRSADNQSRGGVLFESFYLQGGRTGLFQNSWKSALPLQTPSGLADAAAAVQALEAAAQQVQSQFGRLDVAWGEVHRLRRDDVDLPSNGGSGSLGIFRVIGYQPDGQNRRQASFGDSYVAAVEFSEPVRAQALMSYGNSSQPGSAHRTDQMELLSRKQLRPVWLSREEIEANLESRTALK